MMLIELNTEWIDVAIFYSETLENISKLSSLTKMIK